MKNKNNTIIIVEDELIIARELKNILVNAGYNAIANIITVDQAIEAIEKHNPVLVLLDYKLYGHNKGTDIATYLLEKDKAPYIFITSYSDLGTIEAISQTRPYGYLTKPFKPEDVIATISIVINNFIHRNIDIHRNNNTIIEDIPFMMRKVIAHINANINEKIEVNDLALLTPWKSQHFNRTFQRYVGMNPYTYIQTKKIERAASLLSETNIPIKQISLDLGFQSHSNFILTFKKILKETPDEYRKKMALKNLLE